MLYKKALFINWKNFNCVCTVFGKALHLFNLFNSCILLHILFDDNFKIQTINYFGWRVFNFYNHTNDKKVQKFKYLRSMYIYHNWRRLHSSIISYLCPEITLIISLIFWSILLQSAKILLSRPNISEILVSDCLF